MKKRPYKLRKRAKQQQETRQRIVDATVELHGSVGPKNTSISAVAERAGVQRLTVYRHFPDEFALFGACSAHWMSQNPLPDPATWATIAAPAVRTETALAALYTYFRGNASMIALVLRDVGEVEALQAPVQVFQGYIEAVGADLLAAWHRAGHQPKLLQAAVFHSLAFTTWLSLSEAGLSDTEMSRLVRSWIEATAD